MAETTDLMKLRVVKISGGEFAKLYVDKALKVSAMKGELDQKLDLGQAVKSLLLGEIELDDDVTVGSFELEEASDITAVISDQAPEVFETLDNGGRPFQVEILQRQYQSGLKGSIKVYKNSYPADVGFDRSEPVFQATNIERVFIGKSPLNAMTEFSGGHGPAFDGNSILVKQSPDLYVFIGERIISFQALEEIVEYVSPVGNNDVPYPFAVDSAGNHYLIIEEVMIGNVPSSHLTDPYRYYYDKSVFKDTQFKVGESTMALRYTPYPTRDYNVYIPQMGNKMILLKDNVEAGELSEEQFAEMMVAHGKLMHFQTFAFNVIVDRLF